MKGKYKSRTSRVTSKVALKSCPSWAGQELVKLALSCQTPKDQGFRVETREEMPAPSDLLRPSEVSSRPQGRGGRECPWKSHSQGMSLQGRPWAETIISPGQTQLSKETCPS